MTSYLPTIPELTLLGAFERGVPNKERVVLRAEAPVDLGFYAVILGWRRAGNETQATPIADSMYWLNSTVIPANDWVFLFTGPGEPTVLRSNDQKSNLHIIYWNRPQTVFHDKHVIPVLWRLNGITIDKAPPVTSPTIGNLFAPLARR